MERGKEIQLCLRRREQTRCHGVVALGIVPMLRKGVLTGRERKGYLKPTIITRNTRRMLKSLFLYFRT